MQISRNLALHYADEIPWHYYLAIAGKAAGEILVFEKTLLMAYLGA
jgi:hypothetical protein